ncbi:hypothetical protein [Stackebrandtia albiflava]|nr:hypothetical protein [Stackebrandtia albiflava]
MILGASALFATWAVVAPRSAWWAVGAWRYRHPEAEEPGRAGYLGLRIASALLVVMCVVGIVLLSA